MRAFRLYLNKVIKLNYFFLHHITQNGRNFFHHYIVSTILLLLFILRCIFRKSENFLTHFLYDIKIDYQWLHLITYGSRRYLLLLFLFVFYWASDAASRVRQRRRFFENMWEKKFYFYDYLQSFMTDWKSSWLFFLFFI